MTTQEKSLTGSLEDYLETIFELVRDQKLARVRDIAHARGVKSGSVSPAMRRLADLGLIKYVEREYIDLTPEGEIEARRIYAKHQLLTRFFTSVLKMPQEQALQDACAMEHSLSAQAMDHLVRFFEFLHGCPQGIELLERFHRCSVVHKDVTTCDTDCALKQRTERPNSSIWSLKPGQRAQICQLTDDTSVRQVLLEKGLIPETKIRLEWKAANQHSVSIQLQGFQLTLTREEAESVMVLPYSDSESPEV